jgi:hypothetical protein
MGWLAMATLGPAGVAIAPALSAGAAPWIEEMSYMARSAVGRRAGRAHRAIEVASETAGVKPEALLTSVVDNPELLELTFQVIEAAAATTLDLKVQALGQSLGNAAVDHAVVDVELLITAALSGIESPHVRLLEALSNESPVHPDSTDENVIRTWTKDVLEETHPHFRGTTGILAAKLSSLGMLAVDRGWFGLQYEVLRLSDFGNMVLKRLRDAAQP